MHPDALKIHTLVHLKVGISKRVGEAGRGERQRWWCRCHPQMQFGTYHVSKEHSSNGEVKLQPSHEGLEYNGQKQCSSEKRHLSSPFPIMAEVAGKP